MKYYNSKTSNKYKKVVDQLSIYNNIIIIKKDTECEVVILDRTKYIYKCLPIITTKQFSKFYIMMLEVKWKVRCNKH